MALTCQGTFRNSVAYRERSVAFRERSVAFRERSVAFMELSVAFIVEPTSWILQETRKELPGNIVQGIVMGRRSGDWHRGTLRELFQGRTVMWNVQESFREEQSD
jgi:hypothetical protein